jgi:hypothetical protein
MNLVLHQASIQISIYDSDLDSRLSLTYDSRV